MQFRKMWWLLAAISLLLSGCGGLLDDDVKQAKAIPGSIENVGKEIAKREKQFDDLKKSEDWEFLKLYAERENWVSYFVDAQAELDLANKSYKSTITPILKRDEEKDQADLDYALKQVRKNIASAREKGDKTSKRITFLLNAKKNSSDWVATAKAEVAEIDKLLVTADNFAAKPMKDYPAKIEDIKGRLAVLNKWGGDAHSALQVAQDELSKVKSGNADYARLGDSTKSITEYLKSLKYQQPALKKKLDELYQSYTKILDYMRVDYYVQLARADWCESDGCGNGDERPLPAVKVSEAMFNYYDSFTGDLVAQERPKFFGGPSFKLGVPQNMWAPFKGYVKWNRRSYHSYADFYVSKLFTKTYHKYRVIENGKKKDTDWIEVDEGTYWNNERNIGMALVSKPYGKYEEETLKTATLPGIDRIAKPVMVNGKPTGSNQYGEWKQDSSGNSFWHTYGQVRMGMDVAELLFGGNRYSYDDWNGYNSRKDRSTPYYGHNNTYGTWGTKTYGENSRYRNSDFARKNPNLVRDARSGKANKRSLGGGSRVGTVRGAGSRNRGGGPAGGGK